MTIILPENAVPRWQQALRNDRLIEWRALSKWMLAEAHVACSQGKMQLASDLFLLADVAMARALDLQPREIAA